MKQTLLLLFLILGRQVDAQVHPSPVHEQRRSEQRGLRRIGEIVEYHLYVKDSLVNFTGHRRRAIAINGQIPAPTLRFTEGDSAVIYVHNLKKEEISIHWHGVLLPNSEDGVPYLTTAPIKAGMTHIFRFRIIQHGTLWYHSHSAFQEQAGLYGPLVFDPANENSRPAHEEVLQLSDWRDEKPRSIMRSLKRRTEWYAIQKGSVQSWGEALVKGHFSDKVQMEWWRMPGADVSDVYYSRFLMHGQPVRILPSYKKGDSVLLRVINGSAASYFWLQYAGGKMKVVAADGNPVKPVLVDKLLIATAETYEIMVYLPDNNQYEFRATAQDITGSASAFLGTGPQVKAKDIPKLDYLSLMGEMNKMTWMMKGMGMKMKMGLYMKMPEMQGGNMSGMKGMNMENMEMDSGMNNRDSMDMNGQDSAMNMHGMPMDMHPMSGKDSAQHNMQNMDMHMDNMPGMKPTVTQKLPAPTAKKGVKKSTTTKKAAPKKKAGPKKKDPMKGMDMKGMPGMKMGWKPPTLGQTQLTTSLYGASALAGKMTRILLDTLPGQHRDTSAHEGHLMGNRNTDTVPKTAPPMNPQNTNMKNMQGPDSMGNKNMENRSNMGSMPGGKQKSTRSQRDTSRSYMLQSMMTPMPMTGFDFPPGNGSDVVLSYNMLASDTGVTTLPPGRPWREIEITLSGNMQRYVWSINGKTFSEQDQKYLIHKGENVRIVFTNATMMEHPIHLHGHFFRVINNQGGLAPMKHTFNINAMHTQVIEFAATEDKDWFLHCHTLYHMIGGMATVISYEGTASEVQQQYARGYRMFQREHGSQLYPWADLSVHSQGGFANLFLSGRRVQFNIDGRWNWQKSYDLEPRAEYYLDKRQFFSAFLGGEFQDNDMRNGKKLPELERERVATLGLIYTLPFLVDAEARVDHKGNFRFALRRQDIPITTRTRLDFYWHTDKEWGLNAKYIIAKYLAISANYDNQYGWGAGLSVIY